RARALATSRTATRLTSMRLPARRAISSALRDSTVQVPPPTTPRPSKPILMGCSSARGKEAGVADSVLAEFVISVSRYGGEYGTLAGRAIRTPGGVSPPPAVLGAMTYDCRRLAAFLLPVAVTSAHL